MSRGRHSQLASVWSVVVLAADFEGVVSEVSAELVETKLYETGSTLSHTLTGEDSPLACTSPTDLVVEKNSVLISIPGLRASAFAPPGETFPSG